jgi:2-methylcitrate dehydratase PrpD
LFVLLITSFLLRSTVVAAKEVRSTRNNTLELLKTITSYVLYHNEYFTELDLKIAQELIDNANREIRCFKHTDKYKDLKISLGTDCEENDVLINSYGIHHRDFDEMSFSMGGHPTATLLPVISIKDDCKKAPKIFLKGLKLDIALGIIFNPELYGSPYHPTSIIGCIGATAVASKILDLTYDEMINALGISLSLLGGIKGSFGSDAKPLQVALATRNGYFSAKLAKNGFEPNIDLLENNHSLSTFLKKKIDKKVVARLKSILYRPFYLENEFLIKKYPVCGSFHNLIEKALSDRNHLSTDINKVKKITILIHPERLKNKNISFPEKEVQKKFSPNYLYAYAFLNKPIELITVSDKIPEDVSRLMKNIFIEPDELLGKWEYKTRILSCL